MVSYQIPNSRFIRISPNEEIVINIDTETLFIPQPKSKIYLHWYKESKLISTLTLSQPTIVYENVKMINGDNTRSSIQLIKLS